MELFKLKVEKRNKLYFGKFKYKAVCKIQGATYTYYTPDLDAFVSRMEKLRENKTRYGVRIMTDSWQEYWDEVNLDQISKFITWRNVITKDRCMYRIQGDNVSFFSNDLALLHTLDSIDPTPKYYEAKCLNPDTMYFKKNPKHKYRTYFKGKRMPKDFSDNVRTLQEMYKSLNFSKAIFTSLFHNNWHPFRYMHGSYFVEYNDEQMHTILAMWFPDMLAKTYICEKEPKN
jgi:alpha-N-acetylglucosamine transferase